MKTIKVITHYHQEDEDMCEDYASMELFIDGKLARSYSDAYHDNSQHKVEGYLEALEDFDIEFVLEEVSVADFI